MEANPMFSKNSPMVTNTTLVKPVVVKPSEVVRPSGAQALPHAPAFDLEALVKATPNTPLGIWRYGFLESIPDWKIASVPLAVSQLDTLKAMLKANPALAWLKDDKCVALFVPGMDVATFLQHAGIQVNMRKGMGPVSKRLSRILRPQALFLNTTMDQVRFKYVRRGLVRMQSQDGAAWVSRRFLKRMAQERITKEFVPFLHDPDKREWAQRSMAALRAMAKHAQRAEMTILNRDGEWKGHAIMVETEAYDVRLIDGQVKSDIVRTDDRVYLSFQVTHASQLFLDRQSLANLGQFFEPNLIRWTREYLHAYPDDLNSGNFMQRLIAQADAVRWQTDAERLLAYPLFEAIVSGLDPRWFAKTTKDALSLGLKHIEAKTKDLAVPLPGINLYVMPGSVGAVRVPRGHCIVDVQRATLWVNDVDLVTSDLSFKTVYDLEAYLVGDEQRLADLQQRAPGLMQNWGGSDDDDMLRVVQFVDHDGEKKCLLWRSPNKLGEFAVLKFHGGDDLPWIDGSTWFTADSRQLPDPTTWQNTRYLGLVRPYQGQKPAEYSLKALAQAADQMVASVGAVGTYCLFLRFSVGTLGRLPEALPATVEEFLDAAVKTFDDCSAAVEEIKRSAGDLAAQSLTENGKPIPASYAAEFERFFGDEEVEFVVATDHWIDRTYHGVREVIDWYKQQIELTASQARPPAELYLEGLKFADAGRVFRGVWSRYWHEVLGDQETVSHEDAFGLIDNPYEVVQQEEDAEERERRFEEVRQLCEEYLQQFPRALWSMILIGGLADTYARHLAIDSDAFVDEEQRQIRDAAFWQLGEKQGREPGFGTLTIEGLRQIGLIGRPQWDDEDGLVIEMRRDEEVADTTILAVRGLWFNLARAKGWTRARFMGEIDKASKARFKEAAANLDLCGKVFDLDIVEITARRGKVEVPALFSAANGNMLGTLGQGADLAYLPPQVRVLTNHTDDRDVTWLVGEPVVVETTEA
jgi:hypothetical protein